MDADGNIRSLSERISGEPAEGILGLILLFIIFVICGAFFSAAESSFSSMNKIRIKAKAEDGNKRAKNAIRIASDFDKLLTTMLIGNNIVNIASASIATLIATKLFGTSDRVTLLCTVITTLIVFLFSEMIPKSFAGDRSETFALFSARILSVLMKLFTPLSALFTCISSVFTKLLSRFFKSKDEPSITEDELYDIIDTIEEEGVMDEEQGDLFKSALDFSQTYARDVMTMRSDICAIDANLSNEQILDIVHQSIHTRIPVYDGTIDKIIGILHVRNFIRAYIKNHDVSIKSLLMPTFRVSPDAMIDDLLSEMRQHKFYIGVVSDSDGKTLGIVTIEDFLEELVGEIWDEDDVIDNDFIKLGGNRFRVSTHLGIREAFSRAGAELPQMRYPERPILSLILEHFGRLPDEGESFVFGNIEITVEDVENGKIEYVLMRKMPDGEPAEGRE